MSLRPLLVAAVFAVACGPLSPPPADGGTGGGGGSTTGGGGGSTTGGGGGSTTGGGGGATGGGGGSAAFTWVRVTFNPAPSITTTSPGVIGLGRRTTPADTWVGLDDGRVYRAPAGSDQFAQVTGFPAQTASTAHADLVANGDEVLILRGRSVFRCAGTCDTFSDFASAYTVPNSLETPFAFCALGARVLFTSHAGSTTLLYESQRSGSALTFAPVSTDLGVDRGEKCAINENGDVYVPSSSGVAVVRSSGGVATETIDLQGQPGARWTNVAVSGTGASLEGFLVGGGSGLRFARRNAGNATWTSLTPSTVGPLMTTVLSPTAAEFLAGGLTNDSGSAQTIYRWSGTGFVALTPAPPAMEVHRGLVAGPNDVYFGGLGRPGGYTVLHGTR